MIEFLFGILLLFLGAVFLGVVVRALWGILRSVLRSVLRIGHRE